MTDHPNHENHNGNENEATPAAGAGVGEELARVHYLPAERADRADGAGRAPVESDTTVVDGEIVTEEQYRARQRELARLRRAGYRRDVITVGRGVRTAVTHERFGGRAVVRHVLYYPYAGLSVVAKRWRDTHGASRYERMMLAAEMEGNHERLLEWEARDVAEKQRRHARRMEWATLARKTLKYGPLSLAAVAGLLLVLGVILAVHNGDIADVVGPIEAVFNAVAFTVWFLVTYGVFLLVGGTAGGLFYLYHQGRRHGDTPAWLAARPTGTDSVDTAMDESMVMNALRNLGHPALNKKFKEGWGSTVMPTWVQPPLPVGHGWEFVLRLPGGVPATSINARKEVLAHNLGRRPEEVWVDVDDADPMAMKALVLDPGALREPVGDYPLAESGQTDFWTGFPVGIDARWNAVVTPVFERNFVKAGIMGSGKSSLISVLLAGAVLDPVVDIDVFCFAENNDYQWLEPIASRISMGDTAENVAACMEHIQALKEDLEVRGRLLIDYDIEAVTREAAECDERLRPRIVVIDECQSFFRQDTADERRTVVNLIVRLFSAARKYGIVLVFATPSPSDQSLPRDVVAVTSNKACFAIGDKTRNNVVLGEKAYENGLSALQLKPAVKRAGKVVALNDVGTAVTVGFMDTPGILRSYNLTGQQKHAIIARGLDLRGGQVRRATIEAVTEERDVLGDVAAVLRPGEDKVPATDVCARLRDLAPRHRPYQSLTAEQLRDQLAAQGCKVTKVSVLMVFTERVRDALNAREGGNG